MTADRRRQEIVVLPDGTVRDDAAIRDWLASMNPPPRVQVIRLSIPPVSRPALNGAPVVAGVGRSGRTEAPENVSAGGSGEHKAGASPATETGASLQPASDAARVQGERLCRTSRRPPSSPRAASLGAGSRSTVGGR